MCDCLYLYHLNIVVERSYSHLFLFVCFFFFQAEDGIRDIGVTGVQTCALPIFYIVYIYDVNLWEDEPIPVTGLAFALTGALAVVFTILWTWLRGPVPFGTTTFDGSLSATPQVGQFLVVALLVPLVGEAIRQLGPVLLASRPEFDDLMDGLTFGVISG